MNVARFEVHGKFTGKLGPVSTKLLFLCRVTRGATAANFQAAAKCAPKHSVPFGMRRACAAACHGTQRAATAGRRWWRLQMSHDEPAWQ